MMALTQRPAVVFKPAGGYSKGELDTIRAFRRRTLDFYTSVSPSLYLPRSRYTGPAPTAEDRRLLGQFEAQIPQYLVPKRTFLDRVSDGVSMVVQAVVIGGIGVGAAGVAGVGPAAGSGLTGKGAVAAAVSGTKKVASFGSLVKPVTAAFSAYSTVAGVLAKPKSAGMSAEAGFPAYAAQLTPTTPAGVVNGAAAANKAAWLAIAGVVVAVILMKG